MRALEKLRDAGAVPATRHFPLVAHMLLRLFAALCAAFVAWSFADMWSSSGTLRGLQDVDGFGHDSFIAARLWRSATGALPRGRRPHPPLVAATPCIRMTLDEFTAASAARDRPVVITGAQPELADGVWGDPVASPLAQFGASQRVKAYFSSSYRFKAAGYSRRAIWKRDRAVMRWPAEAWITLARAIHLATRRPGDWDHGCCLKLQNIPFHEGDSLLPEVLLRVVAAGRTGDHDNGIYLPQIWAHQAGVVTSLHYDEMNSVILQMAGTRVATLFAPSRKHELIVEGSQLPIEQLVIDDTSTAAATDDPAPGPDLTPFPRAYYVVDCQRMPASCTVPAAAGNDGGTDKRPIFSPLELAEPSAPRGDATCTLAPGDALFIPRLWFHRLDDDPRDAETDLFQVSLAYWFSRA